MTNLTLYSTSAVIVLDADGNRLLAKYYHPTHASLSLASYANPFKTVKDQKTFEAALFDKTKRASGDIILFQNHLVLFKAALDVTFYVIAPQEENELMLSSLLAAFYDAVSLLLRGQIEKRAILENLDMVVLALDESVDDGVILETDAAAIASRCSKPRSDTVGAVNFSDLKIDEQALINAFTTVRDRIGQKIVGL